jgi:hypothetical protein
VIRHAFQIALMLSLGAVLVAQEPTSVQPQTAANAPGEKPRVFITDSQSWEMSGSAGGANGAFAAQSHGGARPQTAEIIKTFGERCPAVIVNNKLELADYIVVLDHEGGKGYLRHRNKVAVFEHASGDVVISHSTLSLGGSVEDACKGIAGHWGTHGTDILAAKQRTPAPPVLVPAAATAVVAPPPASSQASITVESIPASADIEIDGGFVGNTPSTLTLTSGTHKIEVRKKGFKDWSRSMNVTGGSVRLSAELEQASGN